MKKTAVCFYGLLILFLFAAAAVCGQDAGKQEQTQEAENEFIVYSDKDCADNHYYPSESIGDGQSLDFNDDWRDNPQSGSSCIRVKYDATGSFGWAGIYWVNPKGNWGNQKGGYDLRFAKKLTFWVRGEKGGEHIAVFRFGGLKGVFPDSDNHGAGPIVLTDKWQQITIDISSRNMRYISAGFSFAITKSYNRRGCIFYIDNIKYE